MTTPELESQHAGDVTTHISFVAHNADEAATATAKVTLYKGGEIVTSAQRSVELAQGETTVELDLTVNAPALWDIGQPNLYEAEIMLTGDFGSCTAPRVVYGYRWTTWSVDNGFSINGRNSNSRVSVCTMTSAASAQKPTAAQWNDRSTV